MRTRKNQRKIVHQTTRDRADLICKHLSRLLSGHIRQQTINNFAATLINKETDWQLSYLKSVGNHFKAYIFQDVEIRSGISDFFKLVTKSLPSGREVGIPDAQLFREFHQWYLNHVETIPKEEMDYILSGLVNLHSVILPNTSPSKNNLDEIRHCIEHKLTLPAQEQAMLALEEIYFKSYLSKWLENIVQTGYTRRLETLPLSQIPFNRNKSSFVPQWDNKALRNSPDQFRLGFILKDKVIQDLFNLSRDEFLYYLYGKPVDERLVILNLPDATLYPHVGGVTLLGTYKNKWRPVATTGLALMSLNYPLSRVLHDLGTTVPGHGFHDHAKACEEVKTFISPTGDRKLFSSDFSSFTDNFLYKGLQRLVLEAMRQYSIISDFEIVVQDTICEGPYKFGKETIHYGVGTPQGSFASFPLASLTHVLLVNCLWWNIHGRPDNIKDVQRLPAVIVGDDSVIAHEELFNRYKQLFQKLQCPLNMDKTIISSLGAEFCSKTITSTGVHLNKMVKETLTVESLVQAVLYYRGNLHWPTSMSYLKLIPYPWGLNPRGDEWLVWYATAHYVKETLDKFFRRPSREDYKILFCMADDISKNINSMQSSYATLLKRFNGGMRISFPITHSLVSLEKRYFNDLTILKSVHTKLEESLNEYLFTKPSMSAILTIDQMCLVAHKTVNKLNRAIAVLITNVEKGLSLAFAKRYYLRKELPSFGKSLYVTQVKYPSVKKKSTIDTIGEILLEDFDAYIKKAKRAVNKSLTSSRKY